MDLILHIGGEKTGTTALQQFLRKNSDYLLRHTGFLYPVEAPLCIHAAHFPIVSTFMAPGRLEFLHPSEEISLQTLYDKLNDIAINVKPLAVIFSAEHFSSRMDHAGISRLFEWFRNLNLFERIRVIYYARPQDELYVSAVYTALLNGRKVWDDSRLIVEESGYYNHLALAERWEAHAGFPAMSVRAYQHSINIIKDFLEVIGAPLPTEKEAEYESAERVNRSFSYEGMRLLYLINQFLPSKTDDSYKAFASRVHRSGKLREWTADIIRSVEIFPNGLHAMHCLTPQERERIRNLFAPINLRLNAKYGCQLQFRNFDSSDDKASIPDDKEILARALLAVVSMTKLGPSA